MDSIGSYPSIFSVYHKAVQEIFNEPVLVTEKVDGSQFSFAYIDGSLLFRSRKAVIDPTLGNEGAAKQFNPSVEAVIARIPKLKEGVIYRAEAVARPKHNTLCYDRVPVGNLVLFDISDGPGSYYAYPHVVNHAKQLDLEVVPCFHYGKVEGPRELEKYLEETSFLGGQKVEGIVIKNYARFGPDKHPLFAKMVREDFKEAHRMEWKSGPGVVEKIVAALHTEPRWNKAVQHLAERGELKNAPQDIGPLIKEVQADILKEEGESIRAKLFEANWKNISRGVTRGLPEWYKERIKNESQGTSESTEEAAPGRRPYG